MVATVVVVVVVLGFFFSLAARRFEKKSWYQSDRDSVVVVSVVVMVLVVSVVVSIVIKIVISVAVAGDYPIAHAGSIFAIDRDHIRLQQSKPSKMLTPAVRPIRSLSVDLIFGRASAWGRHQGKISQGRGIFGYFLVRGGR